MSTHPRPSHRPTNPCFSSGPCAKRPGWELSCLRDAPLGRSHRSKVGKERLALALRRTREILALPPGYRVGILTGSDTAAFEAALWSLLGPRGVDLYTWESFGQGWVRDVVKELRLADTRVFEAPYGELPDLNGADADRDLVFLWNGTTSGVRVPHEEWIPEPRQGLTLCDATSAAFAQPLPWERLDVVTFSWQKVLGGEAAHGVLILSPRAVERLETYTPPWPMPKLFRLTKGGKLNQGIFEGSTINTPSLLCVEDYLDALAWAEGVGGLEALHRRADGNLAAITSWVESNPWVGFLARDPATRSNTSVCLKIEDPAFLAAAPEEQAAVPKKMAALLEAEEVAYDIGSYRDAPPGLRLWCGATVERSDVEAVLPWLTWAYREIMG